MKARILAAFALLSIAFTVFADSPLRVRVVDSSSGETLPARLYLEAAGQWFYFVSDNPQGTAVRYEKQNWINKNSVEYHTTVSADVSSVQLPAGTYELTVERGKSYFPVTKTIDVADQELALTVPLTKWNDPAARGWFSGDTHLHRTIDELKNVILAEDVNVALPLTNWVTNSDTAPAAGNKNLNEIPDRLVEVDSTHVIWPRNTEYEIFRVGSQRHTLGALFVLGHQDALEIGVPPWRPVVESVRRSDPNALFDMDKLDWPFSMLLPTLAPNALYELANNHVWRTEFAFRNWNTEAPAYMQPPYGAQQGGHRQWIDYTLGMYYTLLNCGLRMPPSAGTANGVHPVPAGFGRVYVQLPDGFSFTKWMDGLKQGRSFVTTGPMLYATADERHPGAIFSLRSDDAPQAIDVQVELVSETKISYGELLINGRPEQLLRPQNEKTAAGAYRSQLSVPVKPRRSGWFAVRFWEPRPDGQSRFVHSAPWYIELDREPVRVQQHEKQYLVGRLQQEMDRSRDVVSASAMHEYERALAFYQSLPVLDDQPSVQAHARPTEGDTLDRWLDNMIVHHRFTAEEVRLATGLSLSEARQAVEARADQPHSAGVRVLPYPGGRHPRVGFLDGAVLPQRETKVSVFPPWPDAGYVVVDVPEAIFSNLGLTYLAHTHIPTIWGDRELPKLEWSKTNSGLVAERRLPNGITFASEVTRRDHGAEMQINLTNGTDEKLTKLRVQVCTMLKGAAGFNAQEPLQQVTSGPFIAVRGEHPQRWIITAWQPLHRVWTNPPVPCVHADPVFPDCGPGETVSVRGGIWFYEGDDVQSELARLSQHGKTAIP